MIIRKAGNYGWPYCVTPTLPYIDYDFDSETAGQPFNCLAPVNDSRHNTGRRVLPGVVQPDVWYTYEPSALFPELSENADGDGISPMAGPAYHFNARSPSRIKWPRAFEGRPLFYEWSRDYVKTFTLDRPHGTRLESIEDVPIPVDNPMDMEFGPDGALYVLDYGDGYFAENPEAALYRIDYVRGNRTPEPVVAADKTVGLAPLTVTFSSAGTVDPDGDPIQYEWDFDADGVVDSTEANPTFTYTENGAFDATLRVTDRTGRTGFASVLVIVGNTVPVVELTTTPGPGDAFSFGQTVTFTVTVTDDAPVDCSKVTVAYVLGHEQHGHPLSSTAGCTGTITTFVDSGHAGASNLRAVFVASYTDAPTDPDVPPLSGSDEVVLTPSA
jgi:PKD repeat protein